MIEAQNLHKQFDQFIAVQDLSLSVKKGELLALLGPNGAGKTTTVRMLSAVLQPSAGTAVINGFDVTRNPMAVRRSIGVLTEQPGLYLRMTGLEYLIFYGRLYGMTRHDSKVRALRLLDRFAMEGTADRRIGEYSKGMRQKIGIIRAMLHNPAVLLLDEPTSAMDPYSAKLVRDAILELRNEKRAVILCTHNLTEAESLADRIAIIKSGHLVATGNSASLKQQLLGSPQLEIELDRPLNGEVETLEALVSIEWVRENRMRYRTDTPRESNPQLVRRLTEMGIGVISLQEVSQPLEQVYLNVVAGGVK